VHDPPKYSRFGGEIMRQLLLLERNRTQSRRPLLPIALCFRMRIAPEPVKLQFDNVCRFRI
jgi:hypothetical protein